MMGDRWFDIWLGAIALLGEMKGRALVVVFDLGRSLCGGEMNGRSLVVDICWGDRF